MILAETARMIMGLSEPAAVAALLLASVGTKREDTITAQYRNQLVAALPSDKIEVVEKMLNGAAEQFRLAREVATRAGQN